MAKQPRKISSRDRRAITKLATRGLKEPASLSYGQIRRISSVALAHMDCIVPVARGRHVRK